MICPRQWVGLFAAVLLAPVALAGTDQDAFRARFGNGVRLNVATNTGYVQDLLGAVDLGYRPAADEDFVAVGRTFIDMYPGLFGVGSTELTGGEVHHHLLSRIGSTDKVSVEFGQAAGEMSVKDASLCVLFDLEGRILAVQNQTVPGALAISRLPSISMSRAINLASLAFGRPVESVLSSETAIVGHEGMAVLAHIVELRSSDRLNGAPIQERFTLDAQTGAVIERENTVHSFTDITGTVNGWASPGILPDEGSNPETLQSLYWAHVATPVGSADTDVNGHFSITYAGSTPQTATCVFDTNDKRARVLNDAGSELTTSVTITPGVPGTLTMNPTKDAQGTAQVNAHVAVARAWQFVKNVDATDTHVDFRALAHVRVAGSCNAYYDGSSINFYANGGGCVDFAYSTIVGHEFGHWLNDKYSSGNGADGFGEGNADAWTIYEWDDRYVGKDCCGAGTNIRDGENKKKYDGTCGGSCSEVHECGKVLMGALWKVRRNLNNTFGDTQGDLIADTLFVKWMQAYNDKTICDQIENHWLALDDTDGNIFNGTPHFGQIDPAFREQGFPGITLTSDCTTPVNYGTGTVGSFGLVPHVTSINFPQIGSTNFTMRGENTLTGTNGFLFIGFAKANLFYGSTLILVDIVGPHLIIPLTTIGSGLPGGGYIEVVGPIPNDIGLDNLHFYSQFLFGDSAQTSGFSATEGLDTTICCGC